MSREGVPGREADAVFDFACERSFTDKPEKPFVVCSREFSHLLAEELGGTVLVELDAEVEVDIGTLDQDFSL